MTEGFLTIGLLLGLIVTLQHVGQWQDTALNMLSITSYQSFVHAKGGFASSNKTRVSPLQNRDRTVSVQTQSIQVKPERLNRLSAQLHMKHERVSVTQSSSFEHVENILPFSIRRSSFIDAGEGVSSSDRNAHDRIASSSDLWSNAYRQSLPLARRYGASSAIVDRPWNRANLKTDWFGLWQGAVPESRMRQKLQ